MSEPQYDGEQRPADHGFWARLKWSVAIGQAAILEERFVRNASRWHRLTKGNVVALAVGRWRVRESLRDAGDPHRQRSAPTWWS
ncbi:hypothetical protein L0U85_07960 [Glycomyces sp. L485]|uniref:hypothetical protein n=1 Tax=Glycomyces sp. L485 TaxID=2909235 RepID=UPI001F4B70F4|nr:hypothetical protein [Glycomyces sp. L485]MCH7230784.1 hypothetical protein [Glycomyces sp. L485]